jgi:hypothetical protein
VNVGPGTHTILVKSWDNGGNIYQSSSTVTATAGTSGSAISLSAPAAGSTVGTSVQFLASAVSQTGYPIASMILYVDDVAVYTTMSPSMNTTQNLAAGTRNIIIKSWDNSGHIYELPFTLNVASNGSAPSNGTEVSNIQQLGGWEACDTCAGAGGSGPSAPYGLTQGVGSPSLDGASAQFWIGGSTPYSDVLWWKKILVEDQLAQNEAAHHFVYDLYFYTDNGSAAEGIEWDVNQFVDGRSYIFGSQCSYRSSNTWDVWDNANNRWVSTGISCGAFQSYSWNHVILEFERTWDNKLHYVAITLNGSKHYLDWYYDSTPTSWSGVTVNYQMDGDYKQTNYSTWVDQMKLTYW